MYQQNKTKYWVVMGLFLITLGTMLAPIVLTFFYSFFSPTEILQYMGTRRNYNSSVFMEIKLSPSVFSLHQYYHVLIKEMTILHYYINSIKYACLILLGQSLIIPMMAFALSRFKFYGSNFLFFLIIALMLLPFQITMVPNVLVLQKLKLMDTVWAIILPMVFSPFYVFMLRQYMVTLPNEIIEACQIDGAGPVRCFLNIVLPICKPILGAAAALSFADCWNMVEQPLTFLSNNTQYYPLSVVFNQLNQDSTGFEFAGAALYSLPALFVYMYFHKDIIEGLQFAELK